MAILKQSNIQSIISSSLLYTTTIGLLIFSGVLINSSTNLSNTIGLHQGKFGPITLIEIYKNPSTNGGFNAGLNLHVGIIYYIGIFFIIGMLISIIRIRKVSFK